MFKSRGKVPVKMEEVMTQVREWTAESDSKWEGVRSKAQGGCSCGS